MKGSNRLRGSVGHIFGVAGSPRWAWMILGGFAAFSPLPIAAQGPMTIVPMKSIVWTPCDSSAPKPEVCQFAYVRGDPGKEPNHKMIKAMGGFVFPPHWHTGNEHLVILSGTVNIAAEDGQERDARLVPGDYLNIPARRVHWGSCPTDCVFYLYVDGPDTYFDAKVQRP